MRIYLPVRTLPTLLLFCLIGIALHFLPTLGVPNPDVISFYRWWAAPVDNAQLMAAIPLKWQIAHNVPSNLFTLYFEGWYPYTGRFDILTISYFWAMARLFDDNGDIWRLAGTLFVSPAIGFFYLIAMRLRMSRILAWLLALSLFFAPIGWLRGIEAEIRAVFFLMLALYLALSSDRSWNAILSAVAMIAAVLTKETFFGAWILIPIFILYREWSIPNAPRRLLTPSVLKQLVPHFAAGIIVLGFISYVKFSIPVLQDYVFQPSAALPPLLGYLSETIEKLQPDLTVLNLIAWDKAVLILLLMAASVWLWRRADYARWFGQWDWQFFMVATGLMLALLFHAVPFYITSRSIEGRYVAPANFFVALLVGLIATPFFRILSPVWEYRCVPYIEKAVKHRSLLSLLTNGLLWVVTTIALVRPIDALIIESLQYRTDMLAWRTLNEEVIEIAPPGTYIVATFPSPQMGEIDALLINALLRGRYDVIYHIGDFPESICSDIPESCQSYAEFNVLQPPLPGENNVPIMYVNVSLVSSEQRPAFSTSWLATPRPLFVSLGQYLRARYLDGYKPYIEYTISIRS